ncbi:MAG TPA: DinB family protein [Blastocatellia bacterium]|nr:DinB family protein [Blastocatellia bacterium]
MRTVLLIVCVLLVSVVVTGAGDGKLTSDEKAKAIKLLQESQKDLLSSVEGLSDEQWNFKPSPFKWSVGETVEHIALAEGLLFGTVQRAIATQPNPEWETKTAGKDKFIEGVLPNRTGRAQAPEAIQPMKRARMSRAEIMKLFKESRANTLKFAETTDLALKSYTLDHPFPAFGTLNAYQWLIYIPLHNMRHNKQISEVKANPGFPK